MACCLMIWIEQLQIDARSVSAIPSLGRPLSMQELPGAGYGQAGVARPSEGFESVGQFLHFFGLSPHDDNFETVIVVHVDVGGGDDIMVVVVPYQGNFCLQFMLMVIVDEAIDSHNIRSLSELPDIKSFFRMVSFLNVWKVRSGL